MYKKLYVLPVNTLCLAVEPTRFHYHGKHHCMMAIYN